MQKAPFSHYINAIGKGQRGARHLTFDEAFDAMSQLLDQDIAPEQAGAFLMLLRMQEESVDELCGFIKACRQRLPDALKQLNATLDIGCYAGKRRQLPWYLLSVSVLVSHGYRVFLHGASEPGSQRFYASHALTDLGLPLSQSTAEAASHMDAYGACYLDLGIALAPLDRIIKLRELFGLRSCANTLARLLNPSGAPYAVQGVYHTHLDERHAQVNQTFAQQSLVFRGDGGDPEINRDRDTALYLTRNGETEHAVMPEAQGWAMKERQFSTTTMLAVWRGQQDHGYADQAVVASLAGYLMLLEELPQAQALEQAGQWWQARDKQVLPFEPKRSNCAGNALK
ncbi:glycosyl transferase family protein [Alteromonas gilva]|uniref:Glycosyl transferase family protein n=1 Tax=Alteromonas gilva TaxID=2987522 RepID=A0ABT5L339_9ALTE|nr:glycosyl transferase family protein [Alteromonas gilva]MDC8831470.1 glycosyl transferase family protein [Alteromonas gilva]